MTTETFVGVNGHWTSLEITTWIITQTTRTWANPQCDGRPAECRWHKRGA